MTPTMPMTTDNIYKFATLLGFALLATVVFLGIYMPEKYGQIAFNEHVELQVLKSKDNPSKEDIIKIEALEMKDRLMSNNVHVLLWGSSILAIVGLILFFWGVVCWLRRVQPKQDELLNLQIEKTKREIQVLDKQLEKKDSKELSLK